MSRVQKATASAIALTITLVGGALVTAPLALPDSQQVVAHAHSWRADHFHRVASDARYTASPVRA